MQTVTVAELYEFQGDKKEALDIYKNVLKKDPTNKKALLGVRRLSGIRKKFSHVNEQWRDFFINMDNEKEYKIFERWLLEL